MCLAARPGIRRAGWARRPVAVPGRQQRPGGGAVIPTVAIAALVALVVLGVVGARAGGADPWRGALRVTFWGALAMAATAAIGTLFGVVI